MQTQSIPPQVAEQLQLQSRVKKHFQATPPDVRKHRMKLMLQAQRLESNLMNLWLKHRQGFKDFARLYDLWQRAAVRADRRTKDYYGE